MKFVKKEIKHEAKREYEIYTYLKAINNPKVEKYGIAAVYHYNENWNEYVLTVFSYFGGGNLLNKGREKYFHHSIKYHHINILIVLREFVSFLRHPRIICRLYYLDLSFLKTI